MYLEIMTNFRTGTIFSDMYIFHLSGKRFTLDDSDRHRERKNKLVLIGKNLDHKTLQKQLESCVVYDS